MSNFFQVEDVKKTYRFYAPMYDFLFGAVLEPGRRLLCKEVKQTKPKKLLEIGVGTGLLLDKYPIEAQITGIDISEAMLEVARKRVQALKHPNITLTLGNGETLPYEDNSFDCVVLPYVLSVTPDPAILVAEARRVCKDEGTILVLNHFSGSKRWLLLEKLVRNFAERIGFRSDFSYEENILIHDWEVLHLETTNLFGLSKFIILKN
nr:class I SAM-dependent methyltransferase [uncultured Undibacterium sp.]